MHLFITALLCISFMLACSGHAYATDASNLPHRQIKKPLVHEIKRLLSTVDVKDGISKTEARNVAQAYVLSVGDGDTVHNLHDAGEAWEFDSKPDFCCNASQVRINKKSGVINADSGASFSSLDALLGRLPVR